MTIINSRDKLVNSKFKSSLVSESKPRKSSNPAPVSVDSKMPGTTARIICDRSRVGIKSVFNPLRNSPSSIKPKMSRVSPGSGSIKPTSVSLLITASRILKMPANSPL